MIGRGRGCLRVLGIGVGWRSIFAGKVSSDWVGVRLTHLELIEFVGIEETILIHIGDLEYPFQRIEAFQL